MAIKKKTMEQIAKENNINLSEENAQKVADAYIQPTLNAIVNAEQNAAAGAQSARKSLESDYFQKYRDSMYKVQSRGLTGGLANIAENRLRMQMSSDNTAISNALIQKQAELEGERGTALSNAQAYKENYLQGLRDRVMQLRADDYAERIAAWQFQQELNAQNAQIAAQEKANEIAMESAKIENDYKKMQMLNEKLPSIMNTYLNYIKKGDAQGANDYYLRQGLDAYGYTRDDLRRDATNIINYNAYSSDIDYYKKALSSLNWKYGADTLLSGVGTGVAGFINPLAGAAALTIGASSLNKTQNEIDRYTALIRDLENKKTQTKTALPEWYNI